MNTPTEISTQQRTVRILLWIITGIYAAMLSSLALDAGSIRDVWAIILITAGFPITILGSVAGAWFLYKRGRFGYALLVTLLPIAHLAGSYFVPGIWSAR